MEIPNPADTLPGMKTHHGCEEHGTHFLSLDVRHFALNKDEVLFKGRLGAWGRAC